MWKTIKIQGPQNEFCQNYNVYVNNIVSNYDIVDVYVDMI